MIKITYTRVTVLLISLLLSGNCLATDSLIKRGEYSLTQMDINNMLAAGEHIAVHSFTAQEKQQLSDWALVLFQREENIAGVAYAFDLYKKYLTQAQSLSDPAQQAVIWQNLYREMVFNWDFPVYPQHPQTLLDVIRHYNPVLLADKTRHLFISRAELDSIIPGGDQQQVTEQEIIAAALLIKQLQLNQQIFNKALQIHREYGDNIAQSIRDLSKIQALGITGEKILETHDDYFLVESKDGTRYKASR